MASVCRLLVGPCQRSRVAPRYRAIVKRIIISVGAVLLVGGCDDFDADGLGDEWMGDVENYRPGAVDVSLADDPFLAELDHVWVGSAGRGHAIIGYDAHENEIGRISVYPLGPDLLRISHRYPRSYDTTTTEKECADVWDITVSLAGEPDQHSADIHQTLPGTAFCILVLGPEAIAGSLLAWARMVLAACLAGGMLQASFAARTRGETSTADILLRWATAATAILAINVAADLPQH